MSIGSENDRRGIYIRVAIGLVIPVAVFALLLATKERTPRQLLRPMSGFLVAVVLALATTRLSPRARTIVVRTILGIWIALSLLLLWAIGDPTSFAKLIFWRR